MERRRFLKSGGVVLASSVASGWWRALLAAADVVPGAGPYGPLQAADANGIQLPVGFTSRVVARTGDLLGPGSHPWHSAPDGGACFPRSGGGWIYVSNSEVGAGGGGVSALQFSVDGTVVDAYGILSGTNRNCAGGPTPWGTWLSCEEAGATGRVYECDPQQAGQGIQRPALGSFNHEAVAVAGDGSLYLTEDDPVGRLYRFVPTVAGNLTSGTLWAATLTGTTVTWVPTSAAAPDRQAATTPFNGGEGIWAHGGSVYFTTKGDRKVWELVPATGTLTVLYDAVATPSALNAVDNVVVHPASGDIYVAEDGGNMELGIIGEVAGTTQVAAFLRILGQSGSEVAGPAFSPDGTRLYFSSQRGSDGSTGITYEVTGPFRTDTGGGGGEPVTVVLPIADDTYVRGGSYADTAYPTATLLPVKGNASDAYTRRSYLAVDVGSVTGAVAAATLRLFVRNTVAGSTDDVEVRAVADTSWTESTLTWNNQPPAGEQLATFVVNSTQSAWFDLGVTSWVAARRAEGATRVAFLVHQPGTGEMCIFNSSESSSGQPELVVMSQTGPPPPPPPNVAPTAAASFVVSGLSVSVDASASTDGDGTIETYSWDFGDGDGASGVTAGHTYDAPGTYAVVLTVTDDDGASASTTLSVTVDQPPPPPPSESLVVDRFDRTVSNGLGAADVGGVWALGGPSGSYSVSGGRGRMALPSPGVSRAADLPAVGAADVDAHLVFSVDQLATNADAYLSVVARKVGNSEYRVRVKARAGRTQIQILRRANGPESVLDRANIPLVIVPGALVHLRIRATGSSPTTIEGAAWLDGQAEPPTQTSATDGTTAIQGDGGVGMHAYVSGSANVGSMEMAVDELVVDPA